MRYGDAAPLPSSAERSVSDAAPRLVPRNGRDLPWRNTDRPVPHPRVGGDAPADPGRSGAAEVPRVARQVPVARGPGGGGRRPTSAPRGGRSATTSARSGCTRSPGSRWPATAASCRRTRRRCSPSRASAPTRQGRSAASPSASARAILDTNVARVLFRVFIAKGDAKAHAMSGRLWQISEALRAAQARLRLQPGAHGSRGHGVRGAQAEVPRLPDARFCRSSAPTRKSDREPRVDVVAAVIDDGRRYLVTQRLAGMHLAGLWEFPGGKVATRNHTDRRFAERC